MCVGFFVIVVVGFFFFWPFYLLFLRGVCMYVCVWRKPLKEFQIIWENTAWPSGGSLLLE